MKRQVPLLLELGILILEKPPSLVYECGRQLNEQGEMQKKKKPRLSLDMRRIRGLLMRVHSVS